MFYILKAILSYPFLFVRIEAAKLVFIFGILSAGLYK